MKSKIINFIKSLILTDEDITTLNKEIIKEEFSLENEINVKDTSKEKFDQIMDFAISLEEKNPRGLLDLIRILLRPLQSELLISSVEAEEHKSHKGVSSHKFFMPNCKNLNLQYTWDKQKYNNEDFLIHLNRDPILPCPWKRRDYISTISHIGTNKLLNKPLLSNYGGEWKQDTSNHFVSIWLPWGIAFVNGGNHSISVGIINGEGTLMPTDVYDMNFLLEKVRCDGKNYILIETNEVLDSVNDIRIAAVFEIGRILHRNKIIPMHI